MKTVILAILDGWGYSTKRAGNPILEANKPNLDDISKHFPMLLLQASGLAVGLKWGDFGNSEVGHLTIGAGRSVQQYSLRIDRAIKNESFFENSVLLEVFKHPSVHLIGLLTAGNVHAEISHILALLEMAKRQGKENIVLHLFSDGKDSGIQECASLLKKIPFAPSTIIGRNYGMDRDNNWDLTQQSFDLITKAIGEKTDDFYAQLQKIYADGTPDTKVPPIVKASYEGIKQNDAFFFFNFREDSIRQLYKLFVKANLPVYSMTQYTDDSVLTSAFSPPIIEHGLSEVVSQSNLRQLHIAETLKYAHATYFFNGLRNDPYLGEKDVLVVSEKDIEKVPAMGACEIATDVIKDLGEYDVIIANFANADMLAHTGNFEATRNGVEAIDVAIGMLSSAILKTDGVLLITSDHGNAEKLIDRFTSEPESRHDGSPVPIYFVSRNHKMESVHIPDEHDISGILADVAPTVLEILNIPQPSEMTGVSLLPKLPVPDKKQQTVLE